MSFSSDKMNLEKLQIIRNNVFLKLSNVSFRNIPNRYIIFYTSPPDVDFAWFSEEGSDC